MMDEHNPLKISEPYTKEQLSALKSVPHPSGSTYGVPSFSNWAEWDRARSFDYQNTKVDYAQKAGSPSASSLIMSGVRWAGSTLPEAPLLVKRTTGDKGESEVVPNHPLVQLWRRPNPYYSGSTMMKGVAFSWIVKGDVYIRKVWNAARTRVTELWYTPHWLIRPRWLGDNRGHYIYGEDDPTAFVNYYEYTPVPGGGAYRLEVPDVIHLRDGINPETRCGQNGIASIMREVFGDNEAANWFAALMENGGVPKFILAADSDLQVDDVKRKEISEAADRASRGDNRNKVLTLSGVKPYKLPFSPDELDLRASRYMSEDRFAAVTGIPAAELELGAGREHSIYNNVRQASERATERFLVPTWNHIAEELTVQLLPDFTSGEKSLLSIKGYDGWVVKTAGESIYVTHDLSKVRALQEDEDAKHKRVQGDYTNKICDLAEARSQLNYDVRDEHKEVFYSAERVTVSANAQPPSGQLPAMPTPTKAVPPDDVVDEAVSWWGDRAPEGAKDLITAVSSNGKGHS
jgi:phage portal protein BeeE